MRHSLLALTLAAMAGLGISAEAEARRGGGRHHERIMEKLDLTDAQQEKLREIRQSHRAKMKNARSESREARRKLNEALQSDASEAELRKLHEELQKTRAAAGDARFEQILAIREVLTPEQRKKFHELKGERRGPGKGRRGRGHGRGFGGGNDEE